VVVRSGSVINDWMASPMVTKVVSLKRHKTRAIMMILTRLVAMTIVRMVVENWT
jgi:hypothetical protein